MLFRSYFPNFFDIKNITQSFSNISKYSLNNLALFLNVSRIGSYHQAGSDSLLTSAVFLSLITYISSFCGCMLTSSLIISSKNTLYGFPELTMHLVMNNYYLSMVIKQNICKLLNFSYKSQIIYPRINTKTMTNTKTNLKINTIKTINKTKATKTVNTINNNYNNSNYNNFNNLSNFNYQSNLSNFDNFNYYNSRSAFNQKEFKYSYQQNKYLKETKSFSYIKELIISRKAIEENNITT